MAMDLCLVHEIKEEEVKDFQSRLLAWYDKNGRKLPWRSIALNETDANVKGYSIWVSEVMLQQTQVSTVLDYFNKWMQTWPSVSALSNASLEHVHKVWAGLGYYSRATRLWEGAKKIQTELNGQFPSNSCRLMKEISGVGRYTASAVASIAFGERVGIVDGNVIRVLSRLFCIGADSSSKVVMDRLWSMANRLVDSERPGDFNQALMELGATVCTPKSPDCASCPVKSHCNAKKEEFRKRKRPKTHDDIEDLAIPGCKLCWDSESTYQVENGVMNYPRKAKKVNVREETTLVLVIEAADSGHFLLLQRPKTGLLANLLEFPGFHVKSEDKINIKKVKHFLTETLNVNPSDIAVVTELGQVLHKFSHIKQTYLVWKVRCKQEFNVDPDPEWHQKVSWLKADDINTSAISTAMKKVYKLSSNSTQASKGIKRKLDSEEDASLPKQKKITQFFLQK